MKISHENGQFWNEDNNCWTSAESAATEYSSYEDAPFEVGGLKIDPGGWYSGDNEQPTAVLV